MQIEPEQLSKAIRLLMRHHEPRLLGFRAARTPYRVFVAEYMLQQTQTATMEPYFARFMQTWPTIYALAEAEHDEVMLAWSGLGYYRRAAYLHQAAKTIVADHGGVVPRDLETLLTLPGIGPYTAGAILSIAYGQTIAAVDGNLVRVIARLLRAPLMRNKTSDTKKAGVWLEAVMQDNPDLHPGDINEAIMDVAATICRPRQPRCSECPMRGDCLANATHEVDNYPLRPEATKKVENELHYLVITDGSKTIIRKRTESLLRGTYEFISCEKEVIAQKNVEAWSVKHVFSHRIWNASFTAVFSDVSLGQFLEMHHLARRSLEIVDISALADYPFSPVFNKAIDWLNKL